jgi:hypothetical protein
MGVTDDAVSLSEKISRGYVGESMCDVIMRHAADASYLQFTQKNKRSRHPEKEAKKNKEVYYLKLCAKKEKKKTHLFQYERGRVQSNYAPCSDKEVDQEVRCYTRALRIVQTAGWGVTYAAMVDHARKIVQSRTTSPGYLAVSKVRARVRASEQVQMGQSE